MSAHDDIKSVIDQFDVSEWLGDYGIEAIIAFKGSKEARPKRIAMKLLENVSEPSTGKCRIASVLGVKEFHAA